MQHPILANLTFVLPEAHVARFDQVDHEQTVPASPFDESQHPDWHVKPSALMPQHVCVPSHPANQIHHLQ